MFNLYWALLKSKVLLGKQEKRKDKTELKQSDRQTRLVNKHPDQISAAQLITVPLMRDAGTAHAVCTAPGHQRSSRRTAHSRRRTIAPRRAEDSHKTTGTSGTDGWPLHITAPHRGLKKQSKHPDTAEVITQTHTHTSHTDSSPEEILEPRHKWQKADSNQKQSDKNN